MNNKLKQSIAIGSGVVAAAGLLFTNNVVSGIRYTKEHPNDVVKHNTHVLNMAPSVSEELLNSNFSLDHKISNQDNGVENNLPIPENNLDDSGKTSMGENLAVNPATPTHGNILDNNMKSDLGFPKVSTISKSIPSKSKDNDSNAKKYNVVYLDENNKVVDKYKINAKFSKSELDKLNSQYGKKGELVHGSSLIYISGNGSFNYDKNRFEIPTFKDYSKIVLPNKVNMVTLGDSYSAAYSPYGGDKVKSYADYLARDFEKSNRLASFDKSEATSGEMTWQTLLKLGVNESNVNMSYINKDDKDLHKFKDSETNPETIKQLREKIRKSNLVTITDNGNDLMQIIKILGYRITSLPGIISNDSNGTREEKINKALQSANKLYARNSISDIEKGNTGSEILDIIGKLMKSIKEGGNGLVSIGPKQLPLDLKKLMSSSSITDGLKDQEAGAELIKDLNAVASNQSLLEKEIRKLNDDALIIHVGYPFPWSSLKGIGEKGENVFETVIDIFKQGTISNHNLYLELNKEPGFNTATSSEEFAKNVPSIFDIHPSTIGHRNIANILETKYKTNLGSLNVDSSLYNDPYQTKDSMDNLSNTRKTIENLVTKVMSATSSIDLNNFNVKDILNVIETNADQKSESVIKFNKMVGLIFDNISNLGCFDEDTNKVKFILLGLDQILQDNGVSDKKQLSDMISSLKLDLGSITSSTNHNLAIDMDKITEVFTDLLGKVDSFSGAEGLDKYENTDPSKLTLTDHILYFLKVTFANDGLNGRSSAKDDWYKFTKSLKNIKNINGTFKYINDNFESRKEDFENGLKLIKFVVKNNVTIPDASKTDLDSLKQFYNLDDPKGENVYTKTGDDSHASKVKSLTLKLQKEILKDNVEYKKFDLEDSQVKSIEMSVAISLNSEAFQMFVMDIASLAA